MKANATVLLSVLFTLSLITVGCGTSTVRDSRDHERLARTSNYDDGYGYRRRPNERLYVAPVTSVHAVLAASEQRCWVERERVSGRSSANVGGAIAGAVVGGILGHQIGSGRGQDLATAGGALAGGAVGANVGRGSREQDVRHCETVASDTP